jgi:hypothetical protein
MYAGLFTALMGLFAFLVPQAIFAQLGDPFAGTVKWQAQLVKQEAAPNSPKSNYRLVFSASIKEGLYVFSTIPPAKEANLPTTIEFDAKAKGFQPVGQLQDEGKPIQKMDDIFETELRYFKKQVGFSHAIDVQDVQTTVKGVLKYQVCDESGRCAAQQYNFQLKPTNPQ